MINIGGDAPHVSHAWMRCPEACMSLSPLLPSFLINKGGNQSRYRMQSPCHDVQGLECSVPGAHPEPSSHLCSQPWVWGHCSSASLPAGPYLGMHSLRIPLLLLPTLCCHTTSPGKPLLSPPNEGKDLLLCLSCFIPPSIYHCLYMCMYIV